MKYRPRLKIKAPAENASENTVFDFLKKNGKSTNREINAGTDLSTRVIRYAVRRLLASGKIKTTPNWKDLRSVYYMIIW